MPCRPQPAAKCNTPSVVRKLITSLLDSACRFLARAPPPRPKPPPLSSALDSPPLPASSFLGDVIAFLDPTIASTKHGTKINLLKRKTNPLKGKHCKAVEFRDKGHRRLRSPRAISGSRHRTAATRIVTTGLEGSVHWLPFPPLKEAGRPSTSSGLGMGRNGKSLGAEAEAALPGWSPAFHTKQLTPTGGRRSPAFSGCLAGEDSWVVTSTWSPSGKGSTEGQFSSLF